MIPSSFIVLISVSIAGFVSAIAMLGWIAGISSWIAITPTLPPMTAHAALLTFFVVASLAFLNYGKLKLARLVAGISVILILILLFIFFEMLPENLTLLVADVLPRTGDKKDLIALNGLVVLACFSFSLLILSSEHVSSVYNSLALISALTALSICLLAIYGYLVGTEFAYWWPSSRAMAPNAAGALLSLAVGIIAISWHKFNDLISRTKDIVFGIQVASGSVLFITALFSGSLALIPLYETLLDKVYEDAKKSIEGKRSELSLFFSTVKTFADSIGIQERSLTESASNELGEEINEFNSAVERAQNVTESQLIAGVKKVEFVKAAVPTEIRGDGGKLSDLAGKFANLSPALALSIQTSENSPPDLILEANVMSASNQLVGIIKAYIDTQYLRNILTSDVSMSVKEGNFYILPDNSAELTKLLRISLSNSSVEVAKVDADLSELLKALSPEFTQNIPPSRVILRRDVVSFLSPLSGIKGYLGFVSRVSPFRNIFKERLLRVLIGITCLVLLATSFIYLLMRKLGAQMLRLEAEVQKSLDVVADELALRKNAQEEIEKSLAEKDVLLKEIHHRVKNNLQIITSILNLQLRRSDRPEVSAALRESADRIQSIALLHETLYRSANFSSINLDNYFTELVRYLVQSYNMEENLRMEVEMCNLSLELDKAIPLGLILTELVTNSLKYAFKGEDSKQPNPKIEINCKLENDFDFVLEYSDNGRGLPQGFSLESLPSLGCRLILTLVKQLNGTITFSSGANGTKFKIDLAQKKLKKESKQYETAANINS